MSSRKSKAIVLAAGRGNRISAVSQQTPKPFLPIDGNDFTFLDWHLKNLLALGFSEVFIVANRSGIERRTPFMNSLKNKDCIHWILNPTDDLSTSGSGHSTWFAFESSHQILDNTSDVYLMDADIVYSSEILKKFVENPNNSSQILVCNEFDDTSEEVMVFSERQNSANLKGASNLLSRPKLLGKGLLGSEIVKNLVPLGEATGILKWKDSDHLLLKDITNWLIRYSSAKTRVEHEEITQWMFNFGRVEAYTFGKEHLFMEVDTPEEYKKLTKEVFPKIQFTLS